MDIDDNLTLVGWLKLMAICAFVLAGGYAFFFAIVMIMKWVMGL